jgi:hypothetical protein
MRATHCQLRGSFFIVILAQGTKGRMLAKVRAPVGLAPLVNILLKSVNLTYNYGNAVDISLMRIQFIHSKQFHCE